MDISAVYRMELIERLDKTIWSKYHIEGVPMF